MANKALFFLVLLAALGTSQGLMAREIRQGDIFEEKGWMIANRPWVPSDGVRSSDMFGNTAYPTYSKNDVFSGMREPVFFGEEMVRVRPARDVPPYPLFQDPN